MQVPKRRLRKKQQKADILAVLNRTESVSRRPTERLAEGKGEPLKPLCIAAGLEPYTETLDRRRAAHLLWRQPDAVEHHRRPAGRRGGRSTRGRGIRPGVACAAVLGRHEAAE